jgi:hypothetical protein
VQRYGSFVNPGRYLGGRPEPGARARTSSFGIAHEQAVITPRFVVGWPRPVAY